MQIFLTARWTHDTNVYSGAIPGDIGSVLKEVKAAIISREDETFEIREKIKE